jgi:catechol 2,3-dioxygenase-like lactoylglutathione lyase family enzyme
VTNAGEVLFLPEAQTTLSFAFMANKEVYRGRLIDHVHLVVRDLTASRRFYQAVLGVLNIPLVEGPDFFWSDELFVSTKDSRAAAGELTGRIHLAFQAPDRATVDRFHAEALAAGGKDNGPPGERPYHPGYYAAFVLDPDGNNIEAVYHGPGQRSAEAIKIAF